MYYAIHEKSACGCNDFMQSYIFLNFVHEQFFGHLIYFESVFLNSDVSAFSKSLIYSLLLNFESKFMKLIRKNPDITLKETVYVF